MYYLDIFIKTTLLNFYFILHYHLFFSQRFFLECLYFSEHNIRLFLFVLGWEVGHPLSTYATWEMKWVMQNLCRFLQGREGYHASSVRTRLYYLFSCFCFMASCFICRSLTLPSFKKDVFVKNGYFSPMRSISGVIK